VQTLGVYVDVSLIVNCFVEYVKCDYCMMHCHCRHNSQNRYNTNICLVPFNKLVPLSHALLFSR